MNDDESDKKNRNNSTSPLSKDIKQNSKDSDHFLKNNKYEEKQNDMTNKSGDLLNHENQLKPQQNLKSKLSENYSHKSMKKILTRDILGLNHQSERDKLLLGVSEARLKGLNPNTPSENKLKSSNLNNSPSPFSHLLDNNKLKQSHSQYNSAVFNKNSGMDIKIIQNQSQNQIQSQRNQKEKEKENQNQSSDSKLKNSLNIQIIQGQGITSTTNKNNFNSVNQLKYSPVVGLGINYGKTPSKNLSHSTNTKKPENEIKKNNNEEIQKPNNEHQELLSSRGKEKGLTSSLSKNSIIVMGRTNDFKPKSKEHSNNKPKSESQNLNPNPTPNSNVKFIQKKSSTSRPKSVNMRFI